MRNFNMALRNLGRNRRRTLLAALSVFFSIMMIVVLDGLTDGFLDSLVRNYTRSETGHLNVTTAAWRSRERFMPPEAALRDSAAVAEAVRATPGIRPSLVAERIRFGVVLSSEKGSKAALGLGGDPETERRLLMLDRSIQPGGAYLAGPGEVVLGAKLAEDLGLGVGDPLKVVTRKADYGLGFKRLRIVGIFRTGVNGLDGSLFQVGLEDARELLGLGAGASQVLVMLEDYRQADAAAAAVGAELGRRGLSGLAATSWTEIGDYANLMEMAGSIYYFVWLIVAFLGAFIIANVMMMVVLERRKEIGILKSMGMEPRSILGLFLAEGVLMGAVGSAAGALAGFAFNAVFSRVGFDMTEAMKAVSFPMDNVVYPSADPLKTLVLFGIGLLVSMVVSYLPARQAARLDPIEAIRSV